MSGQVDYNDEGLSARQSFDIGEAALAAEWALSDAAAPCVQLHCGLRRTRDKDMLLGVQKLMKHLALIVAEAVAGIAGEKGQGQA